MDVTSCWAWNVSFSAEEKTLINVKPNKFTSSCIVWTCWGSHTLTRLVPSGCWTRHILGLIKTLAGIGDNWTHHLTSCDLSVWKQIALNWINSQQACKPVIRADKVTSYQMWPEIIASRQLLCSLMDDRDGRFLQCLSDTLSRPIAPRGHSWGHLIITW